MAFSDIVQKRIGEWTSAPYAKDCIDEIEALAAKGDEKELNERFAVELEFGTGGLRGLIRNGTNGINIYVIARATQGLANYIKKSGSVNPKAVIAYDSRLYSREFAVESARVLASNGIKTYIFKEMRPTPELSFAVRHLGCTAGIVVTASHNPKEYNGHKVHWNDGAQIISPHDKGIIDEVRAVEALSMVGEGDFEDLAADGKIEWIGEDADKAYIAEVLKQAINTDEIKKSSVKVVYSALHGTGGTMIPGLFDKLGLENAVYVKEQMVGDPAFSTVKKPNPEEREALDMAIEYAVREDGDIVIATDPDADRMGIAVKNSEGKFEVLSGNHIGAVIEHYVLSARKENGTLPANGAVVKTIVTTDLQERIAESFSMKTFNVLTGFKYIGEKIHAFETDKDYQYIFGGEESYGYLAGTYARDKDAVCATLLISECCAWLKNRGRTITDYLEEIFTEYGYYEDRTVSIEAKGLAGAAVIGSVMKNFRISPPEKIGNVKVLKTIDYNEDEVYDAEGSSYVLPRSNVLQYILEDGSKVTVRPSGTEPKIKFYFASTSTSREQTIIKIDAMEKDLIPGVNQFIDDNIS